MEYDGIKKIQLNVEGPTTVTAGMIECPSEIEIINKDHEILVICRSGERSQISAELLLRENYKTINISDGFEGSAEGEGWINCGLPLKF